MRLVRHINLKVLLLVLTGFILCAHVLPINLIVPGVVMIEHSETEEDKESEKGEMEKFLPDDVDGKDRSLELASLYVSLRAKLMRSPTLEICSPPPRLCF